jgi:hypothetical protein
MIQTKIYQGGQLTHGSRNAASEGIIAQFQHGQLIEISNVLGYNARQGIIGQIQFFYIRQLHQELWNAPFNGIGRQVDIFNKYQVSQRHRQSTRHIDILL